MFVVATSFGWLWMFFLFSSGRMDSDGQLKITAFFII